MVFLYGKETAAAEALLSGTIQSFHTGDIHELSRALGAYVRSGDLVLLKGSRGCALERLFTVLSDTPATPAEGVA
jgi:UDP-N-acetylmuramyl pentapeptide synthase